MTPRMKAAARNKRPRARKRKVKIFISHSSRDSSLVSLIVDLLKTSDLKEDEIRCTSVPGHGFPMGEEIANNLREDIEESKMIIAVLTKDSLESLHVLLELGAAWGLEKTLIPITGPGVKLEGLPEALSKKHGMRWDHAECWQDFERDVFRPLGKRIKNPKRFNGIIEKLINWRPPTIQVRKAGRLVERKR